MPNFSDKVVSQFVGHTIRLNRYSAGVSSKVLGLLTQLEADLVDDINKYDVEGVARDVYKRARAEALLKQVKATIATHYGKVHQAVRGELTDFSAVEAQRLAATLNKAIHSSVFTTSLTRADLKELVSKSLIQGSPAKDWWSKQGNDLRQRFSSEVRLGVAAGENNDKIVKRIRGEKTRQMRSILVGDEHKTVPVYQGGILDVSKREAQALVRTAVMTVSSNVMRQFYDENADLLKGIGLNVTLDNKTTLICISLSGGRWDLEGNPLPDSTVQRSYPGDPPYHWNCRTVPYPITKSWDELIEEQTGRRLKKKLDSAPSAVRASMDGEVAGDWSYQDWLKSQTDEEQREILGPGRYKLWKAGKLTLSQLVDQHNRPLTLKELKAKYAG